MIEEKLKEEIKEYNRTSKIKLVIDEEKKRLVYDLERYHYAFVLACSMDRQLTSKRAWSIPFSIKEYLGTFEIMDLYNIDLDEYKRIFNENKLNRFNDVMATVFYKAIHKIVE